MKPKCPHEPEAALMNAEEVWEDAQCVAAVLRQNLLSAEPRVKLELPLSVFLSALNGLDRADLLYLRQRIEERLST